MSLKMLVDKQTNNLYVVSTKRSKLPAANATIGGDRDGARAMLRVYKVMF